MVRTVRDRQHWDKKIGEEFDKKVEVIALGASSITTGEKINFEEDLI
jgi:hypothetical protein